jgi:hypothetical protein
VADSDDPDAVRMLLARAIREYSPQQAREPAVPAQTEGHQASA